MSGYGKTDTYRWQEEAFEIEVTVKVPKETRAKDIVFQATSSSIDLKRKTLPNDRNDDSTATRDNSNQTDFVQLIDPNRKLKGRVSLDGTYWVISDVEKSNNDDGEAYREVTVTIEKLIKTPKDDFEVVDYDWKGVFSNEEPEEVLERHYDEPEVLNVREYAQSLGVDIDNINMSMVDKTMFSSGLNLTQSSMEELTKSGYVQEVTQQADGSQYTTNQRTGQPEPISPLGVDSISQDEVASLHDKDLPLEENRKPLPFIDTESPWQSAVPVKVDKETNRTYVQQTRNFTRAAFAQDSALTSSSDTDSQSKLNSAKDAQDPIDLLTVQRLKEILKSQGLKTTGNKAELQDRLRQQVNSLLQGKQSQRPHESSAGGS